MSVDKIMNSEQERYERAKKRVSELKDFYGHLTVYIVVIGFLGIINLFTSDFPWVIFPAGGWGIGLFFHAIAVFGGDWFLGKGWEERKIREYMDRDGFRKSKDDLYE